MATQIYHSSFGRYSLYRETVKFDGLRLHRCANCGWAQRDLRDLKRHFLYRYSYQNDDRNGNPMENAQEKLFCCVGCMRSYYGIEETA